MHERAAATIKVFAGYPVRHWVGALPNPLRYSFGNDPDLLTGGLKAFVSSIFHRQRWQAKSAFKLASVGLAYPGAASFIHRVSADLSTNVHFHVIAFDGVFTQDEANGPLRFHRLPAPTRDDLAQVARRMCRKTCAMLERRGMWHPTDPDASSPAVEGIVAIPGCPVERATFTGEAAQSADDAEKPRAGLAFNVYAGHPVEANDSIELKRLALYVSAPPVTDWQLSVAEGNIVSRMRRSRFNGSTTVTYAAFAFLDRIAALVHRPRARLTRLHGVIAGHSRFRKAIFLRRDLASPNRLSGQPMGRIQAEHRRAQQFVYARASRSDVHICPVSLNRLHLVAITAPNYRYHNPNWIQPDTPIESCQADAKTGPSPILVVDDARSATLEIPQSNRL